MLDDLISALEIVKERSQENALSFEQDALAEAYEYASGRLYVGMSSWQKGERDYAWTCFRKAERRLAQAVGR